MGGRPRRDADGSRRVILIDTSAWIEFLRDTGSDVCAAVDELLDGEIAICDAVSMEGRIVIIHKKLYFIRLLPWRNNGWVNLQYLFGTQQLHRI